MAKLIPTLATAGRLPLEIGDTILEDAQPEAITWVAPFDRKMTAVK